MSKALLDELHWLTEALTAHVDWSRSTGSLGLPRCDAAWLEQRRDHYRRTELRSIEPDETLVVADAPNEAREAALPASIAPTHSAPPLPERSDETGTRVTATTVQSPNTPPPAAAPARPTPITRSPQPGRATSGTERPGISVVEPLNLDPEQRQARLVTLHDEVRACRSCGLCEERKQPAFSRGTGSSKIAFVGEGPGAEEDAQGIPFVGAAGQLLDRMIGAMGLSRDEVYVCNIIKCRPPNNRKPTDDEIATCRHFVVDQLRLIEPQVIVALGATAVEGLLGLKLGITRLRGTWRLYEGRIPVMPTFHPAYLLRKPEAKREVWEDLQAVLARVSRPRPTRG